MKIFEGKSPEERNKIIAATVLGALALFAIGYNVIGFFPSSRKTVSVNVSPSPTASVATNRTGDTVVTALPTTWAFLGIVGLMALAIPNSYVVSAPARGDVPWLAVGGYVVALVAAFLFTLSYVKAREY